MSGFITEGAPATAFALAVGGSSANSQRRGGVLDSAYRVLRQIRCRVHPDLPGERSGTSVHKGEVVRTNRTVSKVIKEVSVTFHALTSGGGWIFDCIPKKPGIKLIEPVSVAEAALMAPVAPMPTAEASPPPPPMEVPSAAPPALSPAAPPPPMDMPAATPPTLPSAAAPPGPPALPSVAPLPPIEMPAAAAPPPPPSAAPSTAAPPPPSVLWPGAEPLAAPTPSHSETRTTSTTSGTSTAPRVELPLSYENTCTQLTGTAALPAVADYVHAMADALEGKSTPSGRVKRADFLLVVHRVLPGASQCPRALGAIFDACTATEAGDYANADQLVSGFSIFVAVDDAVQCEDAVAALCELYGARKKGGITAAALTEYLLATATVRNALRAEGDAKRAGKSERYAAATKEAQTVLAARDSRNTGLIEESEFRQWVLEHLDQLHRGGEGGEGDDEEDDKHEWVAARGRLNKVPNSRPSARPAPRRGDGSNAPRRDSGGVMDPAAMSELHALYAMSTATAPGEHDRRPSPGVSMIGSSAASKRMARMKANSADVPPPLPPPPLEPVPPSHDAHSTAVESLFDACKHGSADDARMHLRRLDALGVPHDAPGLSDLQSDGSTLTSAAVERASHDESFVDVAARIILLRGTDVDVALGPGKAAPYACAEAHEHLFHIAELIDAKRAFLTYDADQSGSIDAKELQACMADMDRHFEVGEVEEYLAEFDANHDNKLQFDEFVRFYDHVPF